MDILLVICRVTRISIVDYFYINLKFEKSGGPKQAPPF